MVEIESDLRRGKGYSATRVEALCTNSEAYATGLESGLVKEIRDV
jgi:hypothetical protein